MRKYDLNKEIKTVWDYKGLGTTTMTRHSVIEIIKEVLEWNNVRTGLGDNVVNPKAITIRCINGETLKVTFTVAMPILMQEEIQGLVRTAEYQARKVQREKGVYAYDEKVSIDVASENILTAQKIKKDDEVKAYALANDSITKLKIELDITEDKALELIKERITEKRKEKAKEVKEEPIQANEVKEVKTLCYLGTTLTVEGDSYKLELPSKTTITGLISDEYYTIIDVIAGVVNLSKEQIEKDVKSIIGSAPEKSISVNAIRKYLKYGKITETLKNHPRKDDIIKVLNVIKNRKRMAGASYEAFKEYHNNGKLIPLHLVQYFHAEYKPFINYNGERYIIEYNGMSVKTRKCNATSISFYR